MTKRRNVNVCMANQHKYKIQKEFMSQEPKDLISVRYVLGIRAGFPDLSLGFSVNKDS